MAANALKLQQEYMPGRSTPGKLANLDIIQVLDRIAEGDFAAHIAKELGVCKAALHFKLRDHPSYQTAREVGTEIRLDHWLENIYLAADNGDLNLARANEVALRRLEWRAEREFPHRWGQKQQVLVGVAPSIDASLLGVASAILAQIASGQVIEQSEPVDKPGSLVDNQPDVA